MAIFVTLHREHKVFDGSKYETVCHTIPAGRYELERISKHPKGGVWLVLKATTWGKSENAWRQHPHEVLILEENGKIVAQLF